MSSLVKLERIEHNELLHHHVSVCLFQLLQSCTWATNHAVFRPYDARNPVCVLLCVVCAVCVSKVNVVLVKYLSVLDTYLTLMLYTRHSMKPPFF